MRWGVAIGVLLCLVRGAPGLGQVNTGKITGFVTDSSGAVIVGASVKAIADNTGIVTSAATAESGEYLINFLAPGTYRVEIEKDGFQKSVQSQVTVDAGTTARADFSLVIGSVGQFIEVAANSISVSTETSELSQTFNYQALDSLPNLDRNPLFQMNLIPGANNDIGSGNYMTNGGENGSAIGQTRPQIASIGGVDANANTIYIEGVFNREPQ